MSGIQKFIVLFCLLITSVAFGAEIKTVVIGMDEDYPPYEFVDEKGEPAGLLVDLTRSVASVMGMEIQFRTGEWQDMVDSLNKGDIDVLQGLSWSESRSEKFVFAPPTTLVNHAVFARRNTGKVSSLEQLAGKEVIVHKGGIMNEQLAAMENPPKLFFAGTPEDVLRLLSSGKHDYAVVPLLPGTHIIKRNRLTNLVPVVQSVAVHKYGYAAFKDNIDLIARFAEGLAILRQTGEYERISSKWLGVMDGSFISWSTLFRYMLLTSVPMLGVFGFVLLWSYSLRKKVTERTASLSHALLELQDNQRQLMQADKMAALGVLVSGVAHEINNPNGLILLNTPIIQRSFSDIAHILEEYYEENGDFPVGGIAYSKMRSQLPIMIEETNAGALKIKRIVNDLKDFARRDDTGEKAVFDLNTCLCTALRLVETEIKKSTDNFSVTYAAHPAYIYGNIHRMEQVIVNLLLNSCQALTSVEDGIRAVISADNGSISLVIEDDGTGIKPEDMNRITDPFFTTKRDTGGTGLGLSVSEGIIKEHGGTMNFESVYGIGTKVSIYFPEKSGGGE